MSKDVMGDAEVRWLAVCECAEIGMSECVHVHVSYPVVCVM